MRILVTNDDGINAPGLKVMQQIALALTDEVWVVAPERDQSGASHSLTLHDPLRCRQLEERVFAISGTPTDCVIMAVRHIMKALPPTLVLSGVNRGANLADDVTYSGTVAGALEGTTLGIRSMALSLATGFDGSGIIKWETASALGPPLIEQLLAATWPDQVLMNINFPDRRTDAVEGVQATRQGSRDQNLLGIEQRCDTWGNAYYWFDYERKPSDPEEGTDLRAVYDGFISVTPLHADLTQHGFLPGLKELLS